MAVSRLICPDCEAVLRPAKPVPEGKKVKCPKCGANFTAVGDGGDEGIMSVEPADVEPAAPPRKKPAPAKPAAKPAQPAKPADDDDEEGGTYGVVKDEDDEEEEEEPRGRRGGAPKKSKKPKIDHVPDMSVKDLRGPAQEAVVSPSNTLLITGLVGFIGWLALLVMLLIPVLFPLEDEDKVDKDKPKEAYRITQGVSAIADPAFGSEKPSEKDLKADKGASTSFLTVGGYDLAVIALFDWYMVIVWLLPVFAGMAFAFFVCVGAVKVQNLESREWGICSSIMAMLPLNAGGAILVTLIVLELLLGMLFDDANTIWMIEVVWAVLLCLGEIAAGVWCLLTLMRQEVKAGFEYKPE